MKLFKTKDPVKAAAALRVSREEAYRRAVEEHEQLVAGAPPAGDDPGAAETVEEIIKKSAAKVALARDVMIAAAAGHVRAACDRAREDAKGFDDLVKERGATIKTYQSMVRMGLLLAKEYAVACPGQSALVAAIDGILQGPYGFPNPYAGFGNEGPALLEKYFETAQRPEVNRIHELGGRINELEEFAGPKARPSMGHRYVNDIIGNSLREAQREAGISADVLRDRQFKDWAKKQQAAQGAF